MRNLTLLLTIVLMVSPVIAGQEPVKSTPSTALSRLWSYVFRPHEVHSDELAKSAASHISGDELENDSHRLKLVVLKNALGLPVVDKDLPSNEWNRETTLNYLSLRENFDRFLPRFGGKSAFSDVEKEFKSSFSQDEWSGSDIRTLLRFEPRFPWGMFKYRNEPTLYLLCRHNREYPCLMIMKDKRGRWVRDNSGKVWSQPKLALSGHGLPAHQSNGNTPQGVFTIDSVMPTNDQQEVFGKFRRLKLEFIESSRKEKKLLKFIPDSLQRYSWWRENVVARDIGRFDLRIHGTGLINTDPASSWYPFYPTSGCIASRENTYDGVTYIDQRRLLDQMMEASGMRAQYENETSLQGLLYVVNINSEEAPVTLEEIEPYL